MFPSLRARPWWRRAWSSLEREHEAERQRSALEGAAASTAVTGRPPATPDGRGVERRVQGHRFYPSGGGIGGGRSSNTRVSSQRTRQRRPGIGGAQRELPLPPPPASSPVQIFLAVCKKYLRALKSQALLARAWAARHRWALLCVLLGACSGSFMLLLYAVYRRRLARARKAKFDVRRIESPTHFDVCVVGGGPAGSTCAFYLAREKNLRVLVIERCKMPRDKVCGDVLAPQVQVHLQRMSLLTGILSEGIGKWLSITGFVGMRGGSFVADTASSCGSRESSWWRWLDPTRPREDVLAVQRILLDERILSAARAEGANVLTATVSSAHFEPDGYWRVQIDQDPGTWPHHTQFTQSPTYPLTHPGHSSFSSLSSYPHLYTPVFLFPSFAASSLAMLSTANHPVPIYRKDC
eukprot:TRINITY_DN5602_c0_g1_i2.p1 TRINITY_DN5602_c0_g1~~TRINITY_DN5602_c0_g1_i2.p1  ORF type:complete len:409 (+),score=47.81 TRINITY_DN5602_c0_g1_i2:190-1416(+)